VSHDVIAGKVVATSEQEDLRLSTFGLHADRCSLTFLIFASFYIVLLRVGTPPARCFNPQLTCFNDSPSSYGVVIQTTSRRQVYFSARVLVGALEQRVLIVHTNLPSRLNLRGSSALYDVSFFASPTFLVAGARRLTYAKLGAGVRVLILE
jgi:hypothetical protein